MTHSRISSCMWGILFFTRTSVLISLEKELHIILDNCEKDFLLLMLFLSMSISERYHNIYDRKGCQSVIDKDRVVDN